jgi:restriction endonuclease S subunit
MYKKFDELFIDETKYGTKIKTDQYLSEGKYPIVDQGQKKISGYTDIEDGIFKEVPAIIFGDHTRLIKYIDAPFFIGADGVKIIRSRLKEINYKYLYYALLNVSIPNTGYNRHFKWLKETKIYYPDSEKQKYIVEVLDKISLIIEKKNKQIEQWDFLLKSLFVEMFGDIHNNKNYDYTNIEEITSVLSGGTPDRKENKYWEGGTINWVKTTELNNNIIIETEEKITNLGLENSSAKIIPPQSILIAMYGQGKTRGMTGYLEVSSATNQACACILPSRYINQKYLWNYLILSYDKLRSMAKGGNQPNLNVMIIKKFPVLIPPMNLQEKFVQSVSSIDKSKYSSFSHLSA